MYIDKQITHDVNIFVPPSNWGKERRENVENLLIDTASHILRLLRNPFVANIKVVPRPIDEYPETLYRFPPKTQYTIKLATRDDNWGQYVYQFAHEFCHVLSDHDKLKCNPNNWFHETICEVASIFTLSLVTERWSSNPLYQKNPNFAESLEHYWRNYLTCPEAQLPNGVSLHTWFLHNEDMLRVADYRKKEERYKQKLVAYKLLRIFEDTPTGWNSIRNLPTSKCILKEYLIGWYSLVDKEDKPFVARISDEFGYLIASNN